jgi:cytochrome c556
MRANQFFRAASLALLVGLASAVIVTAQSKTDEDYDKLMKGVGAANGAMRKATEPDAQAAEATKLVTLFKDAQQFWSGRNNKEAADWAGAAMKHASSAEAAFKAKDAEAAATALKELGSTCQTCHTKYREKTETGYQIKKG